jgi:hypothetical protein
MRSTIEPSAWERVRAWAQRRGVPFLLAIAVEALIALLLLSLAPQLVPKERKIPTVFGFDIDIGDDSKPETKASVEDKPKGGGAAKAPARVPEPVATPTPVPPEPPVKADVLWLTRREYAAADIGPARTPPGADAPADSGPGSGAGNRGDSEVVGRGPRGEPLYAAEWYREPTDAQLGGYLPRGMRGNGWGLIACRTVEGYRVEDCQELGEAPRGSGLARAVRQAAWQFRVRPPRKGGKPLVGAWVRIRIDYANTVRE